MEKVVDSPEQTRPSPKSSPKQSGSPRAVQSGGANKKSLASDVKKSEESPSANLTKGKSLSPSSSLKKPPLPSSPKEKMAEWKSP